jgi:molybdate transport system regulatory protein
LSKLKPAFKLWFETKDGHVFGQGTFELLQKIEEEKKLSIAAKALNISYRHAWNLIKKAETKIGLPLLKTHRGGRFGGGGSELTQAGLDLIKQYSRIKKVFLNACKDEVSWEGLFVQISARNRIEGEVLSVDKDTVAATVKIKIDVPCIITSFITREAVEDLQIKKGDKVAAVVKATEVMVSKDHE